MTRFVFLSLTLLMSLSVFAQKPNVKKMQKSAQKGDIEAAFQLAKIYEQGEYVEQDSEMAFKYYEQAAEKNHKQAIIWMIDYYENNMEANEKLYFLWNEKSANNGNVKAAYKLSNLYKLGVGVNTDEIQSFYYCKKTADTGLVEAQVELANMYKTGYGTKQSDDLFLSYYEKAALNGNVDAQLFFANFYYSGRHPDFEKVESYYLLAAENNSKIAQFCLKLMYAGGLGLNKNYEKEQYWRQRLIDNDIRKSESLDSLNDFDEYTELALEAEQLLVMCAIVQNYSEYENFDVVIDTILNRITSFADAKHTVAQYSVAKHYYDKYPAENKLAKKAYDYCQRAADKNLTEAQYLYGLMEYYGYGTEVNTYRAKWYLSKLSYDSYPEASKILCLIYFLHTQYDKFIESFERNGANNDPIAYEYMSDYYIMVDTVNYEYTKGLEYLKIAVDSGLNSAKLKLAKYYYQGEIVAKNCDEAYQLFEELIEDKCFEAEYFMGTLLMDTCIVNADIDRALKHIKTSADNGFVDAQYHYAELIAEGKVRGVAKKHSVKYYEMAARENHEMANVKLGLIYYFGTYGVKDPRNVIIHLRDYTYLCETGEYQYYLAKTTCENEIYIKHNRPGIVEAAFWCKEAIEMGYEPAKQLWNKYNLEQVFGENTRQWQQSE